MKSSEIVGDGMRIKTVMLLPSCFQEAMVLILAKERVYVVKIECKSCKKSGLAIGD